MIILEFNLTFKSIIIFRASSFDIAHKNESINILNPSDYLILY